MQRGAESDWYKAQPISEIRQAIKPSRFMTNAQITCLGLGLDDVEKFEDHHNDQAKNGQPNKSFEVDPRTSAESHQLSNAI